MSDSDNFVIYGSVIASTSQMRAAAANAARLRMPHQLDARLDAVLDPDGFHIISMDSLDTDTFSEPMARCHAMVKFAAARDPFEMPMDFRLRDFLVFDSAGGRSDQSESATRTMVRFGDLAPDDLSPQRQAKD